MYRLALLLLLLPGCLDGAAVDDAFCDPGEPCFTAVVEPPVECGKAVCSGMCGTAWKCGTAGGAPTCIVTEEKPGKDDGDLCTIDICGKDGETWTHIPLTAKDIDDGDPCTIDECTPGTGVYHVPSCG